MAAARKARGLTQVQLAETLGVSQQRIDHYERRVKKPDIGFVAEIAKVLDVTIAHLIGEEPKQTPAPSALEKRMARIRSLSRKEQEVVFKMLDGLLSGKPAS